MNVMNSRSISGEGKSNIFGEGRRQNSPDGIFNNVMRLQSSIESSEFKKVFESNFSDLISDDKDDFYNINESDFKIQQTYHQKDPIIFEKIESTIRKIENFVKTYEYLMPKQDEVDELILKMTSFLKEINFITVGIDSTKDQLIKALELQTILLSNMIRITQQKMSILCEKD